VLVLAQPGPAGDDLFAELSRRSDLTLLRVATAAAARVALADLSVALVVTCPDTAAAEIDAVLSYRDAVRPGTPVLAVRARPDYVAWFNPLAGDEPGRVLVDSDLDWGQDVLQLRDFFAGRDISELHIAYFGNVRICEAGLPPLRWLPPDEPVRGWIAISEMYFRGHWRKVYTDPCERWQGTFHRSTDGYAWLRAHEPVARAGGSIRIYREALALMERPLLVHVLALTGGNQLRAARLLGVNRNTLRKRCRQLGLTPPRARAGGR